jgi:hypothetical protein
MSGFLTEIGNSGDGGYIGSDVDDWDPGTPNELWGTQPRRS